METPGDLRVEGWSRVAEQESLASRVQLLLEHGVWGPVFSSGRSILVAGLTAGRLTIRSKTVVVMREDFCDILSVLDADVTASLLPRSGNTVRSWVEERHGNELEDLKKPLSESPKKHISFDPDLWTSPNCFSFLAVVAHFLNAAHRSNHVLLGLYRRKGK